MPGTPNRDERAETFAQTILELKQLLEMRPTLKNTLQSMDFDNLIRKRLEILQVYAPKTPDKFSADSFIALMELRCALSTVEPKDSGY